MEHEHFWYMVHWSGRHDFGVAVFICECRASKRVLYDPADIEIVDPKNIQEVFIKREEGRVGVWSGE